VVIVNPSGKIVADFQIEHTAEGWQRWREQVAVLGTGVAACVETSQGNSPRAMIASGSGSSSCAPAGDGIVVLFPDHSPS